MKYICIEFDFIKNRLFNLNIEIFLITEKSVDRLNTYVGSAHFCEIKSEWILSIHF